PIAPAPLSLHDALPIWVAPAHGSCTVVAVPTPSSRANVRRRGDRPLRTLSDQALSPLPINERPRVVDALRLRRPVEDQAGLDSQDRKSTRLNSSHVKTS